MMQSFTDENFPLLTFISIPYMTAIISVEYIMALPDFSHTHPETESVRF